MEMFKITVSGESHFQGTHTHKKTPNKTNLKNLYSLKYTSGWRTSPICIASSVNLRTTIAQTYYQIGRRKMGRSIRLILASPPHTSCQVLADAAAELDVFCINSFQCCSDQISPLTGTLLTWHHSPDKLSPISCAQGDVACQANSYMLIHETSSQTGSRSQKSQQERPLPPCESSGQRCCQRDKDYL